MKSSNTLTVYWSSSRFVLDQESWNLLYSKPESIHSKIIKNSFPDSNMKKCPAVKDLTRNLFSLNSSFEDSFEIDLEAANEIFKDAPEDTPIPVIGNNKVSISKPRDPDLKGYFNYTYNLSWLFFAEEPVKLRITSPYLPPLSPMDGAFVTPGQFDIGKWYRALNLEYVVPKESSKFHLAEGQEIAYLEFLTDKKIQFKEYAMSPRLLSLGFECSSSVTRYGKFKTLNDRYNMFARSNMRKKVLSEIKKNIIE